MLSACFSVIADRMLVSCFRNEVMIVVLEVVFSSELAGIIKPTPTACSALMTSSWPCFAAMDAGVLPFLSG